jgi:hypothetical protein
VLLRFSCSSPTDPEFYHAEPVLVKTLLGMGRKFILAAFVNLKVVWNAGR